MRGRRYMYFLFGYREKLSSRYGGGGQGGRAGWDMYASHHMSIGWWLFCLLLLPFSMSVCLSYLTTFSFSLSFSNLFGYLFV